MCVWGGNYPDKLNEGRNCSFRFLCSTSAGSVGKQICPLAYWDREENWRGMAGCREGLAMGQSPQVQADVERMPECIMSGMGTSAGFEPLASSPTQEGGPLHKDVSQKVALPAPACSAGEGGDET